MGEHQDTQGDDGDIGDWQRLHHGRLIVISEQENNAGDAHVEHGYSQTEPTAHQKVRDDRNQQHPGVYGGRGSGDGHGEHHGGEERDGVSNDPTLKMPGVAYSPENQNGVSTHCDFDNGQWITASKQVQYGKQNTPQHGENQQRL